MSNYLKDLEDSRLLFKTFCDGLMYGMFFYHGENLHRVTSIEGLDDTKYFIDYDTRTSKETL